MLKMRSRSQSQFIQVRVVQENYFFVHHHLLPVRAQHVNRGIASAVASTPPKALYESTC
jgi:hypothetical protein